MIDWLPSLLQVNPWTENTYNDLYEYFCKKIKDARLKLNWRSVWIFPDKEDGKEKIFWHLTSRKSKPKKIPRRKQKFFNIEDQDEPERLPDLRRSERISWIPEIIRNVSSSEILNWDYLEGDGSIKTYLWLKKEDFVVILKKYQDKTYRLITSFFIDNEYMRKDFERKYKNRIK